MHIFKKIEQKLDAVIGQLKAEGLLSEEVSAAKIEATPPREAGHGDVATNAALVIAPQVGKKPKEIAELLAERIRQLPGFADVTIAGPGFINMTLEPSVWHQAVHEILEEGRGYGNSTMGRNIRVNVEYVSANPTGPMHVGHGRGAVYGDALATLLLKAGYSVTKEYYINDAGAQIDKLAESAYLRYRQALGETVTEIPEGLYPGEYLVDVGEQLVHNYGRSLMNVPPDVWMDTVRNFTVEAMLVMIKNDLMSLGVQHDVFVSERSLSEAGKVKDAIDWLEKKGLIYVGVLEPPKGKTPEDWEPREQTLFKSTEFGDDCDRPVKKSDGSWTYFAPDIAYHFDKVHRGFDVLVNVFGADHGGYVKRLKAVVEAFSGGKTKLEVKLCQLVKLMRGGEQVKMSKRAGTFVTLRDVVDEVGKDVFRFIMLTRKNDAPLDFDFVKAVEQSKDNPVFYVQYAHARTRSVTRTAIADMPEAGALSEKPAEKVLARLAHPQEVALIRQMCAWPRVVEAAAAAFEPHRVAFYLQDLAAAFHGLWNLGNDDISLRFLVKDDIELTAARIALARAVSTVIASGLMVLGVEPAEEMR